jgi:hypothetical protein
MIPARFFYFVICEGRPGQSLFAIGPSGFTRESA